MLIGKFWISARSTSLALVGVIALSSAMSSVSSQAAELMKIDQVLADEAAGKPIDRRQLLAQEREEVSQWQSGRILIDGQWINIEALQEHKLAPKLAAYREKRDAQELDIEGHRRLAKWCNDQKLPEMADIHWKAIAATSFNDEEAHLALGHKRINQRWFTSDELHRAAQEYKHQKSALKIWMPQVRIIVRQLQSEDSQAKLEGLQRLKSIDTEDAVAALKFAIVQVDPRIALPLLAKIKSVRSKHSCLALCQIALIDPTSEVGRSAVEGLRGYDAHFYVPDLLQMLEMPIELKQNYVYMPNGNLILHQAILRESLTEKELIEIAKLVALSDNLRGTIHRSQLGFTDEDARRLERLYGGFISAGSPVNHQSISSLEKITEVELRQVRLEKSSWETTKRDMERQARLLLSSISGVPADASAKEFWEWWPQYNEAFLSFDKPVTRRYIQQQITHLRFPSSVKIQISSCLVAGTSIQTADGFQDVDKLRVGTMVPSINISTGEVSLKPIVQVSQRIAEAIYTISLSNGEPIMATEGHKWWIVGKGWLRSRELEAGQYIRTGDSSAEIKKVEKFEEPTEVFNMIVDENHTYFVGENRLLSWDVTWLQPTLNTVPGQFDSTYALMQK